MADCVHCGADGVVATTAAGGRHVKAVAVASRENVQEWKNDALPVGPNQCTGLGRTRSDRHPRQSIIVVENYGQDLLLNINKG
jgi:hypothetical protein